MKGNVRVLISVSKKVKENSSELRNSITEIKILGSGDSFGELALINNQARSATIISKLECKFAVLDKINFIKILSCFMFIFI